ncbi:MAG: FAD-dependent oxidoreductase, partial [Mogibacterium sp.]|nr:FAD-dependent oxidoreductase [Mogibacterium sp.]
LFDSLQLARCALTPSTMQHNKYKIVPTNNPKNVAIVGAGFGGLEAALVLKKRGHKPVVFEKDDKLFGLYNTSAAMSFKDADKELMKWYERELKKWDIDIRLNTEIKDINTLLKAYDDVIVSIGTHPKALNIPGFDKTITFTDLLIGPKADKYDKIVFLGGGLSSCEAAYDKVLAGKHPVVVEFQDDLITAPGTCLANSSFLREALPFKNVPVHLRSSITEIGTDTA